MAGGWNKMVLKVLLNPNNSVIVQCAKLSHLHQKLGHSSEGFSRDTEENTKGNAAAVAEHRDTGKAGRAPSQRDDVTPLPPMLITQHCLMATVLPGMLENSHEPVMQDPSNTTVVIALSSMELIITPAMGLQPRWTSAHQSMSWSQKQPYQNAAALRESSMLEQAPGKTCGPMERGAHAGTGRTHDPAGDPRWSSLHLKDCTPWKGPILEQFMKNCSPGEGPILEKFVEDCLPWEEGCTGAGEECEESSP
ncbi:hypothetical protein BTVI_107071 [Pitangus sulphuratus]|nr:hypothetical protein BTVI_107071 [Pitangus sulphuratus]